MIPLKNSLILAQNYGADLLNGNLSTSDLKQLLASFKPQGDRHHNKLSNDNYSRQEALLDFAAYITPHLSDDALHKLITQLIPFEYDQLSHKSTLTHILLGYEANRHGLSDRLWKPFNHLIKNTFPNREHSANTEDAERLQAAWRRDRANLFIGALALPQATLALYKTLLIPALQNQLHQAPEDDPNFQAHLANHIFTHVVQPALLLNIQTHKKKTYADLILQQLKADDRILTVCIDQINAYDASRPLRLNSGSNDPRAELSQLQERTREELDTLYPPLSFDNEIAIATYFNLCNEIIEVIRGIEKTAPKRAGLFTHIPPELHQLKEELNRLNLKIDPRSSDYAKLNTLVVLKSIEDIQAKLPNQLQKYNGAIKQGIQTILLKIKQATDIIKTTQLTPPSPKA